MANPSARKGSRRERELIQLSRAAGWESLRCPASGGASTDDLPDLIIMRNTPIIDGTTTHPVTIPRAKMYAIEAKASADGPVRLSHEEIFALCRYAVTAGAIPLIAVRPDRKPWSFFEPRELTVAEKSRGVTKAMLPGRSFDEVFGDA